MARRKQISTPVKVISSILTLIVTFAVTFVLACIFTLPASFEIPAKIASPTRTSLAGELNVETIQNEDLSIHFIELGNKYTGDCTYIKTKDGTDMLIDAGSKADSVPAITEYINQYCTDGKLEYVIVTHAHQDHYAGFAASDSIFDRFEVDTIIEFAESNNVGKSLYNKYKAEQNQLKQKMQDKGGLKVFTAKDCINGSNVTVTTKEGENPVVETQVQAQAIYNLDNGGNIKFRILNQKFYHELSSDENNHSVCLQIEQQVDTNNDGTADDTKYYLFTGDLEKEGEESLVEINGAGGNNLLKPVELFKAGHHGSKTSSNDALLDAIAKADTVVAVCCCAGSPEYTKTNENQFPTQAFVDRIANHNITQVFVTTLCVDYKNNKFTSMNGNIVITCSFTSEEVTVSCSNNTTLLKDTDWFKANRKMPEKWKSAA